MKVTPGAGLTLVLPSAWVTSSRLWAEREPEVAPGPAADGELPVDGPAIMAVLAKVARASGELPPEPDVGLADCAAGAGASPVVAVDVWVTVVVPAVTGAVVVVVSDGFTAADPLGCVGTVVVVALICWSTANDGLDPPLPVGTVVVGAAVAVAGAAVVGVVVGATVVTGLAVVAEVPWDWVPAAVEAGAVSAEAGPAFSTRKRPARSAKDATHLRGLTTSFLVLELIRAEPAAFVWAASAGSSDRR